MTNSPAPASRGTSRIFPALFASMTMGLAPFAPEPHIVGKLRWIAGGAVGMGPMDWFDTAMHGAPWVLLLVFLILDGPGLLRSKTSTQS